MMTPDQIADFQRDGAVVVRGVFADWVDLMAEGIAQNMAEPGEYASENAVSEGRFFDDYCNWSRISAFDDVVRNSPAAELSPYYFVEGAQTVSMWMPLDPVREASLRFIAGSHKWANMVRPVSWADDSDFYEGDHAWTPVPDPDADPTANVVLEWEMEPGDAVLFDFRTAHGARGNTSNIRRRALSLRWVGDDARYVARPGRTSPPFPGHGMQAGQVLREDWFPVIWGQR